MRARRLLAAGLLAGTALVSCSNPLARQYEYDEQLYLAVDGSATVIVNASLPALVALRGLAIDPSIDGATDRAGLRRLVESGGCTVTNVGRFWTRHGRRFAQIRITTEDVGTLSKCGLLSWSSYMLAPKGELLRFTQTVGASSPRDPGAVNWDGSEIVGFKLHLPSRIREHNVKKLDGTNGTVERGNILTWEQRLADRRAGTPIAMAVDMDSTSILYTTVWLFAGAFAAAVFVLVTIIWLTIRRGRRQKL